jgi:hypothetical protein
MPLGPRGVPAGTRTVEAPQREVVGVRVLVVYESVLGNTRVIAEAIAEGIGSVAPQATVRCLLAARILGEPVDADLVVVGAPTHFFSMPAERTRRSRVEGVLRRGREEGLAARLEPGAVGPGLREWFEELVPFTTPGVASGGIGSDGIGSGSIAGREDAGTAVSGTAAGLAAAFDTRLGRTMSGGAARRIAHQLRRHEYRVIARPKGFVVEDLTGPLRAGERERAVSWGKQLGLAAGWWQRAARDARWVARSRTRHPA